MTFSNPVVGGENGELIRASIQSPDFVTGVSGWSINRDGSAEFNNIDIRLDAEAGSITVGPAGSPQVVITSDEFNGRIEFPTGSPFELTPAFIESEIPDPDPAFSLDLRIQSATTVAGSNAFVDISSNRQDGLGNPSILVGADPGPGSSTFMRVVPGEVDFVADLVSTNNEIIISPNLTAGNNPGRVVRGRVEAASNNTTISKVSDTLISQAATASTRLENGVAYRVDVQIRTSASAGTSAAGTQGVSWKLWDGAVGGTQLGSLIQVYTDSVGTRSSSQQFSFVFEHTGTTGSRTLNLSGMHFDGADTLIATTSTQFYLIVNRIGRASNIVNL